LYGTYLSALSYVTMAAMRRARPVQTHAET
jgi:hypothetical protein